MESLNFSAIYFFGFRLCTSERATLIDPWRDQNSKMEGGSAVASGIWGISKKKRPTVARVESALAICSVRNTSRRSTDGVRYSRQGGGIGATHEGRGEPVGGLDNLL